MAKLTPYIISEDARAQAAFYISSLGGEIVSVMTHGQMGETSEAIKDKVMHMCIAVAGCNLFMSDFDGHTHGNGISLNLEFASEGEGRDAYNKLSDGGNVLFPFGQAPWGGFFGQFVDKFGVSWMFTAS
ncbi:VOC family protein [Paenibacillus sp. HWE-109]|uniref:VOC family protein n=1 Tax=Paenibacillus sp. HWE-109 TaxID=1306526 RepID=UPI001EDF3849|nr:VOC family protein [Paenibacillus sp. HWE-109]UKS29409.1 VOC family protein [Paenibacillus sp. HWE-109]